VDVGQARQRRRRQRDQPPHAPRHHCQGHPRAGQREQHRLGEELAHQAAPSGTERRTDGEFARAAHALSQCQAGDVHAGHDQHDGDAAEQQEQRRAHATDGLLVQWHHGGAPAAVRVWVGLFELAGDGIEAGGEPIGGDGGVTPPDDRQVVHVASEPSVPGRERIALGHPRRPQVDTGARGEAIGPEHRAVREHEVVGHHADDGARLAVDGEYAAEH